MTYQTIAALTKKMIVYLLMQVSDNQWDKVSLVSETVGGKELWKQGHCKDLTVVKSKTWGQSLLNHIEMPCLIEWTSGLKVIQGKSYNDG